MVLADVVSVFIRRAELAFAAIVACITGAYLHEVRHTPSWGHGRFIYTEMIAGLSIILAAVWLFPFSGSFIRWLADLVISICWWASFGLMVDLLHGSCGDAFDWDGIRLWGDNACAKWKADIAFAFLSALFWLVSAVLGIYWVRRHRDPDGTCRRRRWYRSYY